jgi:hypothetical protein
MLDPSRGSQEPEQSAAESRQRLGVKILNDASLFVASLVDLLVKRSTDESRRAVELLRREGVVSGREFATLVEARPRPEFVAEIVWAYSYITKRVVDIDIAQGLPALVSIAHHVLTAETPYDDLSQRRLFHILDRVLDARMASDDLAEHLSAVLSPSVVVKLEDLLARAPQDRKGYWEALELMCAVRADSRSLDHIFIALDRIGARRYTKVERSGVHRCVSAVASENFSNAFEHVARAVREGARSECASLLESTATGLAFHAERTVGALARYLASSDAA